MTTEEAERLLQDMSQLCLSAARELRNGNHEEVVSMMNDLLGDAHRVLHSSEALVDWDATVALNSNEAETD